MPENVPQAVCASAEAAGRVAWRAVGVELVHLKRALMERKACKLRMRR
jgi:hypothetical protein